MINILLLTLKQLIEIKAKIPFLDIIYKLLIGLDDAFGIKEIFLARIFFFGIIFNLIPATRDFALFISPVILLIVAIYVIYPEIKAYETKFFALILIIFSATIALESIGTQTGLIFGSYIYGNTLGLKVFEVPLLIGTNWVIVILGTTYLASKIVKNKFLIAFYAGIIAVVFDFLLEPVAIILDYWNWEDGIIPMQNYIAWFVITFVFSLIYVYFFKIRETKRAGYCMIYQFIFFGFLLVFI